MYNDIIRELDSIKEKIENHGNTEGTLFAENDAEWVLLARKKLGLDQKEFGSLLGVSVVTVSNLENANFPLNPKVRYNILLLLKEHRVVK